jgi:CheY-like chemotaxis protein/HPt (histidine-containing phosphotransfer) domain-containing protein
VVDGILEKPFQQSKLFSAVTRVFGWDDLTTGKFRAAGVNFNRALMPQLRGAHLLLVEDDEINQQVAREMIESYGIKVTVAENGEEALLMLRQEKLDGVLMDMQMPVMDGFSTTREIRKDPQYANLPIIALTANVMVSEQNAIMAAGMNDHVGKPIDPDRLATVLAKWIHPARTAEISISDEAAATPESVASTESLPDLPGVKVGQSVRRIGGNVELYYSLLEKFRKNQSAVVSKIREALASNDPKTAERLAHTLRGIAGTLGAESLQAQAEILELNFKNGSFDNNEFLLLQLEQEMKELISRIDKVMEARGI